MFSTDRGIKGIDYGPNYGHYLVSWGFDTQVHVWNPCSSLTKPYFGTYDEHNCVVQVAAFFKNAPRCVSIDQRH